MARNYTMSYVGTVLADLHKREARILSVKPRAPNHVVITAHVPLRNMFGYATDFRSITQGRGTFSMEFYRYEPVK